MSPTPNRWQTQEQAQVFLEGIRGAIPAAALQWETLERILTAWRPQPRQVLDLGCGDGTLGHFVLGRFPTTEVTFADFSKPMLDATRARLGNTARARIIEADFSSPNWIEQINHPEPFCAVISGFAIHHLSHWHKRRLYSEIFGLLDAGGVFLNVEHVASPTAPVKILFDDLFVDSLWQFHRRQQPDIARNQVADTYYNRPDKDQNILATVDLQCRWLRRIGFGDVDCFFKLFELSIFGGRKPVGSVAES